jgi:hypothetical protein
MYLALVRRPQPYRAITPATDARLAHVRHVTDRARVAAILI